MVCMLTTSWLPPILFSVWIGILSAAFILWLGQAAPRVAGWPGRYWGHRVPWPTVSGRSAGVLERRLRLAGWRRAIPRPRSLVLVGSGPLLGFLVLGWWAAAAGWLIFLFTAVAIIFSRARRQRRRLLDQLPDALDSLVDALRAGYSLPSAVALLGRELEGPLQAVFAALTRGLTLGLPWTESLKRVSADLGISAWGAAAETLAMGESLGGNFITLLAEQTRTLREQARVHAEIKTLTAAGRLSGNLIAGLVPLAMLFFWAVSPSYISVLFSTFLGRLLCALAVALEVAGIVWIWRITRITV